MIDQNHSDDLLKKEEEKLKELDIVLEQEEMVWFQKSREKWVAHGDQNTKFSHLSTVIRRRRNCIDMLKDEAGNWVSDPKVLEVLAVEYFWRLYSLDDVEQQVEALSRRGFASISLADYMILNKPFLPEEIGVAVRSMGSFKARGPDGFQPVFYQKSWDMVGESVSRFVLDFFAT